MKRENKVRIISLLLAVFMVLGTCLTAFASNITSVDATQAQEQLIRTVGRGNYEYQGGDNGAKRTIDYSKGKYSTTGGGYLSWSEIVNSDPSNPTYINTDNYSKLTNKSKKQVLEGMFEIANALEDDCSAGRSQDGVSSDTIESMMVVLQNNSGQGSQMLAMLMKNTKPNYIAANKIYEPFSGTVGTVLALIAILIMALLGLTMALDIAYIVIPAFQMLCGGGSDAGGQGGPGGKKSAIGGFISSEAKHAVKSADGGAGGQGGGGEYKAAIGTYLKHRWIGLTILGICLLYLVQGEIYNFVAWFVDLFSGFLNF